MNAHATVSLSNHLETEKTNKTDTVSNDDFLQTVFGAKPSDARPVVVSFDGDPVGVSSRFWFGAPWPGPPGAPTRLSVNANNYFSLAVFLPDEAGHFRRQKARFHALYVVMLDDIGTKVAMERLTLGRLLTAWQAVFSSTPAMVRDAIRHSSGLHDEQVDLREVLDDIAAERGDINRRRLGWWIKRHAGRIVDGRRFVRASGSRSADAWVVESVSPVMSVSAVPIAETVSGPVATKILTFVPIGVNKAGERF